MYIAKFCSSIGNKKIVDGQVWDLHPKKHIKKLEKAQNKSLSFIYCTKSPIKISKLNNNTNIVTLKKRRKDQ